MRLCFAFLFLMASSARADFNAARSYRLAPKSAALGGMGAGLGPSLEAGLLDPSMLPMNYEAGMEGFAASLDNSLLEAVTASLSPWRDAAMGLSWASFGDARQAGAPFENEAGLSLATQGSAHSLVGLRGKWMQVGGGILNQPVQGAALDAGIHFGWQGLFGRPLGLSLGAAGVNLADTLPKDWSHALGREISVSAVLSLGRSFSIGAESAWDSQPAAATTLQAWRLGLEWRPLSFLALRSGWRTAESYSAGFGLTWGSAGLSLDYAWLEPQSQHRLGLSWRGTRMFRPDANVKIRELSMEGPKGQVSHAGIDMNLKRDLLVMVKSWKLDLKAEDGSLVKEFSGIGPPPSSVEWDGTDKSGMRMDAGGQVSAEFSAELPGRTVRADKSAALEQAYVTDAIKSFLKGMGEAYAPAPQLEPAFSNDDSGAISQVAIHMPDVADGDVKGWELKIQGPNGNAVRTMKGSGALPSGLVWDGKNDQGHAVEGAMGLRVLFSYQDSSGQVMTSMQPLLTEDSLQMARLKAGSRPKLKLEGLSRDFYATELEPSWSENFLEGVIK